ncbi:hypothetical protein T492DRAFT_1057760, partial [Pavlovales sp. CCMP2436]
MQRLAASQCSIACHIALAALRIRLYLRWKALPDVGPRAPRAIERGDTFADGAPAAHGEAAPARDAVPARPSPPAERVAVGPSRELSGQPQPLTTRPGHARNPSLSVHSSFARSSAVSLARVRVPPAPAKVVGLLLLADWVLTLGAVLTVNWGFVTCSNFLQGCGTFHSWAIEWAVFALWPIGSAVAMTTLHAVHRLGRACDCRAIACGVPSELMVVRAVAVGQVGAAGILLAVISANSAYGTSGAGALGADLAIGPGLGALGCHTSLAVLRVREAVLVRRHTTFGSERARWEIATQEAEGGEDGRV